MKLHFKLLLTAGACAALAGCSTVSNTAQRLWPFGGDDERQAVASDGERVSILQFEDSVEVSSALAGRPFNLPTPRAVTAWAQPGGTAENAVEHAQAGESFRIAWRRDIGEGSGRTSQVTSPIVASDGRLFVLDGRNHVSAVDAASGMLIWVRDLGLQAQWILGCRGDRVILSGERLWGIDRQDGSIRWEIGSRDVELQAYGRGILTDSAVLWPLREELLVVDHATGSLRQRLPLAPQNALASGKKQTAGGGHLTPLTGGLLISHAAGMTLFPALPAAPANLPTSREPRLPVKKDPAE